MGVTVMFRVALLAALAAAASALPSLTSSCVNTHPPKVGQVWSSNFTFQVTIPFVPHFKGFVNVDNTKNIERQDYVMFGRDLETLEFFTPNTSYATNLFGKCKKGPISGENAARRF